MKHIEFKRLRLHNFMSFGDVPVEITIKNGVTFITGFNFDENSYNGVGKTSLIIESLSFVLFGEAYRDILKGKISNWDLNDTCSVELWLDINQIPYYISRSISPSNLVFEENNIPIQKTIPETNKEIIFKLGISKDIFNNTLAMTNDTSVAFLRQKVNTIKTKFIEGILSLEVYAKMFEKTKQQFKDKDKEVDIKRSRLEELTKSLNQDKKYKIAEDERKVQEIAKYNAQIKEHETDNKQIDNTSEIDNISIKISKLSKTLDTCNTDYSSYRIKETELETEKKGFQKELDKFNKIKTECPTCKRPMGDHKPEEIQKEKDSIQVSIDKCNSEIDEIASSKRSINNKIVEIENSRKKLESSLSKLIQEQKSWEVVNQKIAVLHEMIESAQNKVNLFDGKIIENEKNIESFKTVLSDECRKLKTYEISKIAATLIKANAIKKIIKTMNNRLNYYLERLGAVVSIHFDEFFEEKIIYKRNKLEIGYGSLSGGEAKRVDVALLFAFRDIRRLQSGVSINISVFDELFDSAIDGKAMQDILTLLKEMSDNEGFYIITHRESNVDIHDCDVIRLEKRKGISRIV